MTMRIYKTYLLGLAFVVIAGCSAIGSGSMTPAHTAVASATSAAPAAKVNSPRARDQRLLAEARVMRERFAAARATMRHRRNRQARASAGCTALSAPNVAGLTAKTILTHSAWNLNVDGTGCDIAVYIPQGVTAKIFSSRIGGAGTAQIAADENAQLNVTNSHIVAGQQTVGVYFLQDGNGSVSGSEIDVTGPAPSNAPPIFDSAGPTGIISPANGNLDVSLTRIATAQNGTGIIGLGNTSVEGVVVQARPNPAYGPSQELAHGIYTNGTSTIRDSTFDVTTGDGLGIGMEFNGFFGETASGSATDTVVAADYIGQGLIFAGDVALDGSLVKMATSTPQFGTIGVREVCSVAIAQFLGIPYPGTCSGSASIHHVTVKGIGFVDPYTPDYADDSLGFQFTYATDFRDDTSVYNSVGYYSCGTPGVTSTAALQAQLTAANNKAFSSVNADFYADPVSNQLNDCS